MYLSVKSKKLILERLIQFYRNLPWFHARPGAHSMKRYNTNESYDEDNSKMLCKWINILQEDGPDVSKVNWIEVMYSTNNLYKLIRENNNRGKT